MSRGPWDPASCHGGPVGALLARAVEQVGPAGAWQLARLTVELTRPVPVGKPLDADRSRRAPRQEGVARGRAAVRRRRRGGPGTGAAHPPRRRRAARRCAPRRRHAAVDLRRPRRRPDHVGNHHRHGVPHRRLRAPLRRGRMGRAWPRGRVDPPRRARRRRRGAVRRAAGDRRGRLRQRGQRLARPRGVGVHQPRPDRPPAAPAHRRMGRHAHRLALRHESAPASPSRSCSTPTAASAAAARACSSISR